MEIESNFQRLVLRFIALLTATWYEMILMMQHMQKNKKANMKGNHIMFFFRYTWKQTADVMLVEVCICKESH